MKFYSRAGLYKASNVTFDPTTCVALSYNWWIFVRRIDKTVIFNDYRYSATTQRHQRKVQELLSRLGITIDLIIEAPRGLQNLSDAFEYYNIKIANLMDEIKKPRS